MYLITIRIYPHCQAPLFRTRHLFIILFFQTLAYSPRSTLEFNQFNHVSSTRICGYFFFYCAGIILSLKLIGKWLKCVQLAFPSRYVFFLCLPTIWMSHVSIFFPSLHCRSHRRWWCCWLKWNYFFIVLFFLTSYVEEIHHLRCVDLQLHNFDFR